MTRILDEILKENDKEISNAGSPENEYYYSHQLFNSCRRALEKEKGLPASEEDGRVEDIEEALGVSRQAAYNLNYAFWPIRWLDKIGYDHKAAKPVYMWDGLVFEPEWRIEPNLLIFKEVLGAVRDGRLDDEDFYIPALLEPKARNQWAFEGYSMVFLEDNVDALYNEYSAEDVGRAQRKEMDIVVTKELLEKHQEYTPDAIAEAVITMKNKGGNSSWAEIADTLHMRWRITLDGYHIPGNDPTYLAETGRLNMMCFADGDLDNEVARVKYVLDRPAAIEEAGTVKAFFLFQRVAFDQYILQEGGPPIL